MIIEYSDWHDLTAFFASSTKSRTFNPFLDVLGSFLAINDPTAATTEV